MMIQWKLKTTYQNICSLASKNIYVVSTKGASQLENWKVMPIFISITIANNISIVYTNLITTTVKYWEGGMINLNKCGTD